MKYKHNYINLITLILVLLSIMGCEQPVTKPISIGILLIPLMNFSQEDLTSTEEYLEEQQDINFQTFFFEALQQKAIGNFDKAIFALEACHNIESENVAVLFEMSKNYALLISLLKQSIIF